MLHQLQKREQRSAIGITASVAADYPIPGSISYSAAKRFVTDLAVGLNYELKDQIDVISYNPGFVATKLNSNKPDYQTLSADEAAGVFLRDFGCESMTHGAFRHEFTTKLMDIFPRCIVNPLIFVIY